MSVKHDDKEMETEAKYTDHGTENKNKNEIVERYETNNRKGMQDNGCGNGYCGDAVDLEKFSPFEPEKSNDSDYKYVILSHILVPFYPLHGWNGTLWQYVLSNVAFQQ